MTTLAEIEAAYQKDCERSSLGQVVGWATWQVHAERFRDDARQARAEVAEVRRQTAQRCAEIAEKRAKRLYDTGAIHASHGAHQVALELRREFFAELDEQPAQPQADDGERLASGPSGEVSAPGFRAEPWYNPYGDSIHCHWREDEFYADRINDKITIYRAIATKEAVGCEIKGVAAILKLVEQ